MSCGSVFRRCASEMDNQKENTLVADARQRLDVSLACIPDMGSRSQAQKAIRAGNVTVDGKVRTTAVLSGRTWCGN